MAKKRRAAASVSPSVPNASCSAATASKLASTKSAIIAKSGTGSALAATRGMARTRATHIVRCAPRPESAEPVAPMIALAPPCRYEVGAEPRDQRALARVGAESHQFAEAAHRVGHGGAQVGTQRHGAATRRAAQALRQQRQRNAGKDETGAVGERDRTAEQHQEGTIATTETSAATVGAITRR